LFVAGMGHRHPKSHAAMRAMKAEGGWGVVCTEETEIHPSSDLSPDIEGRLVSPSFLFSIVFHCFTNTRSSLVRLWDEKDLPAHELLVEGVHKHGGLAGIQLVAFGFMLCAKRPQHNNLSSALT
jgi:dimethylamine/trimethylamine dehydrogenase